MKNPMNSDFYSKSCTNDFDWRNHAYTLNYKITLLHDVRYYSLLLLNSSWSYPIKGAGRTTQYTATNFTMVFMDALSVQKNCGLYTPYRGDGILPIDKCNELTVRVCKHGPCKEVPLFKEPCGTKRDWLNKHLKLRPNRNRSFVDSCATLALVTKLTLRRGYRFSTRQEKALEKLDRCLVHSNGMLYKHSILGNKYKNRQYLDENELSNHLLLLCSNLTSPVVKLINAKHQSLVRVYLTSTSSVTCGCIM
uniref:Uncharacterized protein n=1 Tax=Glossina austeni TaxID=7395 RepID=A0A1A9UEG0_GLOAU